MSDYVILGAGGHSLSVLDMLKRSDCRVVALIDPHCIDARKFGLPVLKKVEDLPEERSCLFVLGMGDNWTRQRVLHSLLERVGPERLPSVVCRTALVSGSAVLEPGVVIMSGSYVGPGSSLGQGALVNTRAVIEHETLMSECASVAPGVIVGGRCSIGLRSAVGIGSTLRESVNVGGDTVVGSASYVHSDLPDRVVAFGVPARVVNRRAPNDRYLK